MATHLTMNTVIHAAFRRDIARFEQALDGFPPGSRSRADALLLAWHNVANQLQHHHESEETIFFPAAKALGVDAALLGDMDGEHERMISALETATKAMGAFAAEPTGDTIAAAHAAIGALSEVINLHFAHEERDLEPLMAKYEGTPEMKRAAAQVRKAQSLPEGAYFLTWLQDGAGSDEIAALQRMLPKPVFVVAKLLGRSYTKRIAPVWATA